MKSKLKIDLSIIQGNYKYIQTQTKAKVASSVKGDACGLGIKEVGTALFQAGCRDFFVAHLDESTDLRKILPDPKVKIYLLHGIEENSIKYLLEYNIIPVLNNLYQIELWEKHCPKKTSMIHLDTGMNRYGILTQDFAKISKLPESTEYVISHIACDHDKSQPYNKYQLNEYIKYTSKHDVKRSLAASGAIFFGPEYHFDMVRPGGALYGIGSSKNPNIKNPISLTSQIIHINKMIQDSYVGYNNTYLSKKGSKLATIPIGYADGFSRRFSNSGFVFINDIKAPIIGSVSMDLLIIDVTEIDCKIGDIVEIIGPNNSIDLLSSYIGTSGHEIITSLKLGRYEITYKK